MPLSEAIQYFPMAYLAAIPRVVRNVVVRVLVLEQFKYRELIGSIELVKQVEIDIVRSL